LLGDLENSLVKNKKNNNNNQDEIMCDWSFHKYVLINIRRFRANNVN